MSAGSALYDGVAGATPRSAATLCYHCGTPNPARARWSAPVAGATRDFCCAGCVAVAQTLHAAGLDSLYAARIGGSVRAEVDVRDDWAQWAEAAEAAGLVRVRADRLREASLIVEGMTCGACVPLVESWLARQPGVVDAHVNYATRRAQVAWDPDSVSLVSLLRAIASAGYAAYPYDPARRESLARRERRALLARMAIALLAMMQVMMLALPRYLADDVAPDQRALLDWASLALALPAIFYCAWPFAAGAWRDLAHRRLGMDVPIMLGIGAAFAASAWSTLRGSGPVYYDSVTMFIALLLVARYVEMMARQRSSEAIESLARQRPDTALRVPEWPLLGVPQTVAAATLVAGDIVLIRPGEHVPADGEVVEGRSHVEEALLTGESQPRLRSAGEPLLAGAVNCDNALVMRVTAAGEDTRLAAIVRLAERAAGARPAVARTADRVAGIFVASLLILAAVTALFWLNHEPARALAITFAVLAVSCPCALALATPAALAAAAGSLARRGVILTRSDAQETLAKVTHVVFDKTGTLTEGKVRLVDVLVVADGTRDEVLQTAAALEARSEHPLARALGEAAPEADALRCDDVCQIQGEGVAGRIGGVEIRIGRPEFVGELAGAMPAAFAAYALERSATLAGLGDARGWRALFAFADVLRPGGARMIASLRAQGVTPIVLSGDRQANVDAVAAALSIADARGDLRPAEKRDAIVALQCAGAVVAMTGDGINDAPALAQAQVSVSLGSAAPLAQWSADVVILSDRIERMDELLRESRRTFRVIRQNLAWALAYNAIAIPAAALGFVTPLVAAAGMAVSSLLVVGNALRLARTRIRSDAWKS
jgi:Cu2+-exporting ATPase